MPDERVRAGQHAESQDAVHVAVSVQRPARARRLDGARSRLPRLAQLSPGADVRLERNDSRHHRRRCRAGSRIPNSRRFRRSATSPRPNTLAGGQAHAAAPSTDCRCWAVIRCPSRRTTAAASARSTATRCSRRTASASTASGACRSSTCAIASSRRSSTSCRSATGSRSCRDGVGARDSRRLADQHDPHDVERISENGVRRHRPVEHRRRPGSSERRPDRIRSCRATSRSIARWFNTDAYALNALGTLGNAGRNTFFGPGITNVDASIIRNFRMSATRSLQFRLEAFNAAEQPDLERPEHDADQPALRHDQQHEKADARAAARSEVLFWDTGRVRISDFRVQISD